MFELSDSVVEEILAHAGQSGSNECCGFVVEAEGTQKYVPCVNVSETPETDFEISPEDYIKAEEVGRIAAVVHSHTNGNHLLSGADRQMQAKSGLHWVLVADGHIKVFRPCPHLRGRTFEYGVRDCGTLIRDVFMLAGLDLPDHERTDIDKDAADEKWLGHLAACGAFKLDNGLSSIQAGDVIMTSYGGNANHAAFYLGDGKILHHAYGELSRVEDFGSYWSEKTHSVWRHPLWQPHMMKAVESDLNHREELA